MCSSPVTIKNPLFCQGVSNYKDSVSEFIKVPCGHCTQCLSSKSSALNQRVQVESLYNYVFFLTLTFDNNHLPFKDFGEHRLYYAPWDYLTKMLKRARKHFEFSFKYLFVNDYGSQNKRPHFHGLIFVPKYCSESVYYPHVLEKQLFDWFKNNQCVNIGSRKEPIYDPVYRYVTKYVGGQLFRSFDLHLVENRNGDTLSPSYYVSKYLYKRLGFVNAWYNIVYNYFGCPDVDTLEYDLFRQTWNLFRINRHCSIDFGLKRHPDVRNMILEYGNRSFEHGFEFPMFYDISNNHPIPMCGFYRKILPLCLLAKFRQSEFDQNGCITYSYIERHKREVKANLFDFIDFL